MDTAGQTSSATRALCHSAMASPMHMEPSTRSCSPSLSSNPLNRGSGSSVQGSLPHRGSLSLDCFPSSRMDHDPFGSCLPSLSSNPSISDPDPGCIGSISLNCFPSSRHGFSEAFHRIPEAQGNTISPRNLFAVSLGHDRRPGHSRYQLRLQAPRPRWPVRQTAHRTAAAPAVNSPLVAH